MQNQIKTQMNAHFGEVRSRLRSGKQYNLFAHHVTMHVDPAKHSTVTKADLCSMVQMRIVWQGNPISCMETFGTYSCGLCVKERLEILPISRINPNLLINLRNRIHGACRHKTKFHRFKMNTCSTPLTSTDNGVNPERVIVTGKDVPVFCAVTSDNKTVISDLSVNLDYSGSKTLMVSPKTKKSTF